MKQKEKATITTEEMARILLKAWVENEFECPITYDVYSALKNGEKEDMYRHFIKMATEHYKSEEEAKETFWAMLDEFRGTVLADSNMLITGVRKTKVGMIKRICVDLDSTFTDGHIFCEMLIDDENGRFTAVLYGGESYTFKSNNNDFMAMLVRELKSNSNGLYLQLRDARLDYVVNIEETTKALISYIRDTEEYKENTSNYNIDEMESEINDVLNDNAPLLVHSIWDVWHEWFTPFINDGLLPSVNELHEKGMELIQLDGDKKCRIFCELVAPILAKVIEREYQLTNS